MSLTVYLVMVVFLPLHSFGHPHFPSNYKGIFGNHNHFKPSSSNHRNNMSRLNTSHIVFPLTVIYYLNLDIPSQISKELIEEETAISGVNTETTSIDTITTKLQLALIRRGEVNKLNAHHRFNGKTKLIAIIKDYDSPKNTSSYKIGNKSMGTLEQYRDFEEGRLKRTNNNNNIQIGHQLTWTCHTNFVWVRFSAEDFFPNRMKNFTCSSTSCPRSFTCVLKTSSTKILKRITETDEELDDLVPSSLRSNWTTMSITLANECCDCVHLPNRRQY